MEFRILGPLEASDDGRTIALGGTRQRALLALLLLRANEVVASDRVIEELWEGSAPEDAARTLQVTVSRLRKALEPRRSSGEPGRVIETTPPGYRIRLAPGSLDLHRFEALLEEGQSARAAGDPQLAAQRLRQALSLWRGEPLADLAYESFAQVETARFAELRLRAVEERIAADLDCGRGDELVAELEALVAQHPLRERLCAQLMLALYRSGRQAEALETYRATRGVLVQELGIEPGRELQELHEAILRQDPGLEQPLRRPPSAVEPPADPATRPAAWPAGSSFVGREGEVAQFLSGLEDAVDGRTAIFLIAGEPGIGKSRLADELTLQAEARDARVLWGRCWEAGGAPAYWPWVQTLRGYIRGKDPDRLRAELGSGAADVAQMVPELHDLFPDLPAPPSLDPEGARFRLFDSTASFLRAAGQEEPLVLVLDDLHAADEPSLLLLRFLARQLREARVIIVAAYRDREAAERESLRVTIAELHREPITRPVQLGGLTLFEVGRFIDSVAEVPPGARVAAAIHAETEGNPLFVGELVRLLASEGRLEEAGSTDWRPSIPRGLREVIGQRLRHLSGDCKHVLSVASVLGREFRLDALERVSRRSGEELLDLLDEGLRAGVIGELPSGRRGLRFSHALIRDSLYGDLGTKERLQLHRRMAEALEELYGEQPDEHLAELAHHYLEAPQEDYFEKAIDYSRRAAERAAALLAYEEAVRLYGMALEALELGRGTDDRARCDLLLGLGDAEARAGHPAEAKARFVEAASIARRISSPDQLARAALGYGGRFVWFRAGSDRRLITLLETALEGQPGRDSLWRARLLSRLAGALRDDPVPQRRAALSGEAVEIARRAGDRATLAYTLEGTYAALSLPEGTSAWVDTVEEMTRLAEEAGDREQLYYGRIHALISSMVLGDLQAVAAELRLLTALAEELRQPAQRWPLAIVRGCLAAFTGKNQEADELMQQVAEAGPGVHGLDATFYYVLNLQQWAVRRAQGRLAEIEESMARFVEENPTWPLVRCALASLLAELGRKEQAQRELDLLAANDFAALHLGTEWFFGASLLAEVCAVLKDTPRAERLYELLAPYPGYNVVSHPEVALGSAARYLGILAATLSRWEEAARHFEYAIGMNTRMGARPWVAHTKADYARMLGARDGPGDTEKAAELARGALATYRRLGMDSWATKLAGSSDSLPTRG